MTLTISEVFGPTIAGEGRHAGRLAAFLRLSGCNLSCSWCDTPYTWDWSRFDRSEEARKVDTLELAAWIDSLPMNCRIVVSGGEPLAQHRDLAELMALRPFREWDLETNGTKSVGETVGMWSTITVSPKVGPSAGQLPRGTMLDLGTLLSPVTDVKFVIRDPEDLDAALACIEQHQIVPERVWLMPEGRTPAELGSRAGIIADAAVDHGFNFTHRLHVLAWGDERGH